MIYIFKINTGSRFTIRCNPIQPTGTIQVNKKILAKIIHFILKKYIFIFKDKNKH